MASRRKAKRKRLDYSHPWRRRDTPIVIPPEVAEQIARVSEAYHVVTRVRTQGAAGIRRCFWGGLTALKDGCTLADIPDPAHPALLRLPEDFKPGPRRWTIPREYMAVFDYAVGYYAPEDQGKALLSVLLVGVRAEAELVVRTDGAHAAIGFGARLTSPPAAAEAQGRARVIAFPAPAATGGAS